MSFVAVTIKEIHGTLRLLVSYGLRLFRALRYLVQIRIRENGNSVVFAGNGGCKVMFSTNFAMYSKQIIREFSRAPKQPT